MKVEKSISNRYEGVRVSGILHKVEQTAEQRQEAEELIEQAAVSLRISKMGFTPTGKTLPYYDRHEVYLAQNQLLEGISRTSVIEGKFVGMLAENYKSMADSVKENYTGNEYDQQMYTLNRAYEDASTLASWKYRDEIRDLANDSLPLPTKLTDADYYTSAAEAEAHWREEEAKEAAKKEVLSEEKGRKISSDVFKYLEAAKASVLAKGFFDWQDLKDVKTDVLNIIDLQKMGPFFMSKGQLEDISGVSSFVSEIFSAYTEN